MVLAIWLAMQNSSCMGISERALLKVTARMEVCTRPGGMRELVAGRSAITHGPIECFCCKLMPEQLRSTNHVAQHRNRERQGLLPPLRETSCKFPARSQHRRAISLLVAPVRFPKLPVSLDELGSWELQVLLGFLWERRENNYETG